MAEILKEVEILKEFLRYAKWDSFVRAFLDKKYINCCLKSKRSKAPSLQGPPSWVGAANMLEARTAIWS